MMTGPAGARFNLGGLVRGGAARRAARRAGWGGAAVVRVAAGEAGAPPQVLLRGGGASAAGRRKLLRGWQSCARLSVSPEVRCVAFTAPSRLLCLLVCYRVASSESGASSIFESVARQRRAREQQSRQGLLALHGSCSAIDTSRNARSQLHRAASHAAPQG